jgi:hypothetical protein
MSDSLVWFSRGRLWSGGLKSSGPFGDEANVLQSEERVSQTRPDSEGARSSYPMLTPFSFSCQLQTDSSFLSVLFRVYITH